MRNACPARRQALGKIHTPMAMAIAGSTHDHPVAAMTIGADDYGDRADRVRQHLEIGALDAQRLLGTSPQQEEGDEVGEQTEHRHHEHRRVVDVRRVTESANRLEHDVGRNPGE